MDTKHKTDRTERQSPDISVCVHVDDTTEIQVSIRSDGDATICIKGWAYPSVSVFMNRDNLIELRDTITEYLGDGQ